jgi:transcriptional regulator with XRE-family HTH domain
MYGKKDKLGTVIKSARVQSGLTQKELGGQLNVSRHHIMRIENGVDSLSFDLLFRLVRLLRVPADLIFYPEYINRGGEYHRAALLVKLCSDKNLNIVIAALEFILKGT